MERVPLLDGSRYAGELHAQETESGTLFSACCTLPHRQPRSLWAVGSEGEVRLGVMEGEEFSRCFSRRMTAPLGRLCRGELRPLTPEREGTWERAGDAAALVDTPWLKKDLSRRGDILFRRRGELLCLALPFDSGKPFPLLPFFCFARIQKIGGKEHAVFTLNKMEWPVV